MDNLSFIIDTYPLYDTFKRQFVETIRKVDTSVEIPFVIDDFFEICLYRASDSVKFVDLGEQQKLLNPLGTVRQMVSLQIQDIYFDELSEYVVETDYFTLEDIQNKGIALEISSICLKLIDDLLRQIMLVLLQFPDGHMYFNASASGTTHSDMTDLLIRRIVNRHDIHVYVGFE
jgi:hypothetical protein